MAGRKLDDWIESFMKYTENTEPPDLYRRWTAISSIAAALKRKCYLQWGLMGNIYPNMYIVLVGPSGARKTTAMKNGAEFLEAARIKFASDSVTREALIGELEGTLDSDISSDGSPMSMHSSLTVISPELTVFLGTQNPELLAMLADWFDCANLWRYKTKTSGENEVVGVWVNILGATTPHLIRTSLPPDAIGGGLASRIIFVYAETKGKLVPYPFPDSGTNKLRSDLIHDFELILGLKGEFNFTSQFRDRYVSWYIEQEQGTRFDRNPNFEGYVSRRPLHLIKLCMIVSASMGNKMTLDAEVFDKALSYLNEVEVPMQRTFQGLGSGKNTELVERIMSLFAHRKVLSRQDLYAHFRADIDNKAHLDEMVELLIDIKFIKARVRTKKEDPHVYEYCYKQD